MELYKNDENKNLINWDYLMSEEYFNYIVQKYNNTRIFIKTNLPMRRFRIGCI